MTAAIMAPLPAMDFTLDFKPPSPRKIAPVQARFELLGQQQTPVYPARILHEKMEQAEQLKHRHLAFIVAKAASENIKAARIASHTKTAEREAREKKEDAFVKKMGAFQRNVEEQRQVRMAKFHTRDFCRKAATEARLQQEAAMQLKASLSSEKLDGATLKRQKILQTSVERNRQKVRHAKEIATKLREHELEQTEQARAALHCKSENATLARAGSMELRTAHAKQVAQHARQVAARQQHEDGLLAEQRATQLQKALEEAAARREEGLAQRVARSANVASHALEQKEKAQEQQRKQSALAAHALMQRLQEAECRRLQILQSKPHSPGKAASASPSAKTPPHPVTATATRKGQGFAEAARAQRSLSESLAAATTTELLEVPELRRPSVCAPAGLEERLLHPAKAHLPPREHEQPGHHAAAGLPPAGLLRSWLLHKLQVTRVHNARVSLVAERQRRLKAERREQSLARATAAVESAAFRREEQLVELSQKAKVLGEERVLAAKERRAAAEQEQQEAFVCALVRQAVAGCLRGVALQERCKGATLSAVRAKAAALNRAVLAQNLQYGLAADNRRCSAAQERRGQQLHATYLKAAAGRLKASWATQARISAQWVRIERAAALQLRCEAASVAVQAKRPAPPSSVAASSEAGSTEWEVVIDEEEVI